MIPFEEAVEIAQTQVYAVTASELNVRAASVELEAARDARWPLISLEAGGGQRYGLGFDQTTGGLTQTTVEAVDLGLSVSYELFGGRTRRARLRAAESNVQVAGFNVKRERQRAFEEVVRGYLEVSQAATAKVIAEAELTAQARLREEVRALVDLGTRPPYEVDLQNERVAAATGDVLAAQRDGELAEARLVSILGLDPMQIFSFPPPTPGGALSLPLDSLVSRALRARPDLQAATAAIRSAEAERDAVVADRWPRAAVVATLGSGYTSANGSVGLFGQIGDNRAGALGLRVSLPLLDGGTVRARIRRAEIRAEALRHDEADLRRAVALDIRERAIELQSLTSLAEVAGMRVGAAEAALSAETARYEAGETTLQSVLVLRAQKTQSLTERGRLEVSILFKRHVLNLITGSGM